MQHPALPASMNVLIADDQLLYRDALRLQVERPFPEAVIVEATSFDETVRIGESASSPFEMFLLDYHMPGMRHDARKHLADAAEARTVIHAGALGFIPKTATSREREVLRGVMRGLSNKQIGRELDLAEVTVKLLLRTIFRKIGAGTRSEAAVLATKTSVI